MQNSIQAHEGGGMSISVVSEKLSDGSFAYNVQWFELAVGCVSLAAATELAQSISKNAAWFQVTK